MKQNNDKRLWDLYNVLSSTIDVRWTQKAICNIISEYKYIDRPNDRCSTIREDMLKINNSPEFDKIVVCKNYCFKLATPEEAAEYYNARVKRLKEQVKQMNDLKFKMKRDGHGDLLVEDKWWESYVEEC